jgi:hypothetical protein
MTENGLQFVDTPNGPLAPPDALVHGYAVSFFWGSVMFLIALVVTVLMINAKKDEVSVDAMAAAA